MTQSIISNKDKIWHRQGKDVGVGAAVSAKMAKGPVRYANPSFCRHPSLAGSRAQFSIRGFGQHIGHPYALTAWSGRSNK
jgi:hypothetical protein